MRAEQHILNLIHDNRYAGKSRIASLVTIELNKIDPTERPSKEWVDGAIAMSQKQVFERAKFKVDI